MSLSRQLLRLLTGTTMMLAASGAGASNDLLPPGKSLPGDLKMPSSATMAVYLPTTKREFRLSTPVGGLWAQPGHAFEESISGALQGYFAPGFIIDIGADTPFGLLLAIGDPLQAKSRTGRPPAWLDWAPRWPEHRHGAPGRERIRRQ